MFAQQITIETINLVVRAFADAFQPAGPVLDIGAYYTPEYAALCDRRTLIDARPYVGVISDRVPVWTALKTPSI